MKNILVNKKHFSARAANVRYCSLFLGAGFSLFLSACGGEVIAWSTTSAKEQLAINKKLWESASVEDYTFVLSDGSFLWDQRRADISITVSDGEVQSAWYVSDGADYAPKEHGLPPQPIDGVFSFIESTIGERPYNLVVEYDPVLGYPASIMIDELRNASDDTTYISVKEFAISE